MLLNLLFPRSLREGLHLLRPYLPVSTNRYLAVLALIGVLTGLFEATALGLVGALAATLADSSATGGVDLPAVGTVSTGVVLFTGLVAVATTIVLRAIESALVGELGARPMTTLRTALVVGHLRARHRFLRRERNGELQDLLMSHVVRAGFFIFFLAGAIPAAATFAVLAAAAAVIYPIGFLLVLGTVAVLGALTFPLQRVARRYGRMQADSTLVLAAEIAESAASATEIQVFDATEPVLGHLSARIDQVSVQVRIASTSTRFLPHFYRALVLALLLIGLAVATAAGVDDLAVAGTMVLLLVRALMASQIVNSYAQSAAEYVPFIEQIVARLDDYEANRAVGGNRHLEPIQRVELIDVRYSYDMDTDGGGPIQAASESSMVLRGVDLRLDCGEAVGICGPSGSGKSTLLAIVLGLIEPSGGVCLLNGGAPASYDAASLARQVAMVPQQPLLLTSTVAENIRFFRPEIDDAGIRRAAAAVGLDDEIRRWADGYDTIIGERGARSLSGGQRQRIGIARALAGMPSLLVLDEPTSALDGVSQTIVANALRDVRGRCALLVVSHRPETLAWCERVVELQDGRLYPVS